MAPPTASSTTGSGKKKKNKKNLIIRYLKFMQEATITPNDHSRLALKLEDYLTCSIEFAGKIKKCNLENVMGSFYSNEDLPQYCYSIYSLWGKPNAKKAVIAKGSIMRFHIFVNISGRPVPNISDISDDHASLESKYNPPSTPAVQLAVHSPYFLPSPYLEGTSYLGGRAYELRLNMEETHLLPAPYQTNCTDYMTMWKARGGKSPINQLGVIQECRLNRTYEALGCVPIKIDYPHNYTLCKFCQENCRSFPTDNCTMLADALNQPCDSISYSTIKEDRAVEVSFEVLSLFGTKGTGKKRLMSHDCDGRRVLRPECSTIEIDVLFDRFQITNLTYNPKFESLELFSVLGGYMGMWLGISFLTIYDFLWRILSLGLTQVSMRRKQRVHIAKKKRNEQFFLKKVRKGHFHNY